MTQEELEINNGRKKREWKNKNGGFGITPGEIQFILVC